MISRLLTSQLIQAASYFPVVSLTGPRQSGKTTLLKETFADYRYISLENPDNRRFATEDPRGFLSLYDQKVIIDEAQKVPELFSYIQGIVDEKNKPGMYILSGSQNFLLHKKITQSLAGRVAVMRLLPFSIEELKTSGNLPQTWTETLFKGFYPRIYDVGIPPGEFYPNYIETYVERDVEEIVDIRNVSLFRNFVKLCAGRVGQVLNISSLASDAGISPATAREWLSLLEGSYLIFFLQPYFRNFSKRLIKSPKLYFYDTGLAASLLGITEPSQLFLHYMKGNLFENMVISELYKSEYNAGRRPALYFWRDSNGNEIDCLSEKGQFLDLIEIKASQTINPSFFKGFTYFEKVAPEVIGKKYLIYAGDQNQPRTAATVLGWESVGGR
ncbi:MAG: ATP-binding protein [Bacteroidia bacterium]|nr:ATP-binding protein [Bacteroidia bacterium]